MELNSRPFQEAPKSLETEEENHPQMGTPAVPPATERRSRRRGAREVSSRYMMTPSAPGSPSPISSSSGDLHLAASPKFSAFPPPSLPLPKKPHHHQRQRRHPPSIPSSPVSTDSEADPSSSFTDENHPGASAAVNRSSETPLPLGIQSKAVDTQRKRAMRLFHDNSGDHHQQQQSLEHLKPFNVKLHSRKPRPDTPMANPVDRCPAGSNGTQRLALLSQKFPRSMNLGTASVKRTVAEGAKPEPSFPARATPFASEEGGGNGSCETSPENRSTFSEGEACSVSSQGGFCESPPLNSCRVRKVSEFRSSMPEADLLPTMSGRRSVDGGSGRPDVVEDYSGRVSSSLCYRSLSSALSNCQQHPINSTKSISKPPASLRPYSVTAKTVGLCLPPQQQNTVQGLDSGKGRKASNRQEDGHSLRMVHNYYLQWRFANAKAHAAVCARAIAAEKSLYGVSDKISELQTSVKMKRTELELLKRRSTLSTIVEAQVLQDLYLDYLGWTLTNNMPCLDEWAILERDHSSSLSGAIKALQDASLRLPLIGNVMADIGELNELLESATSTLEALSPCVGKLLPRAEEMEDVSTDLARLVSGEKALIEECGDLLLLAHGLQVKECSLRSQLLQLKRSDVT